MKIVLIFARSLLFFATLLVSAGTQATEPPQMPAPVRHTLEYSCNLCHSEPHPDFGGLDTTHWVETSDGHVGFLHLDFEREQLPSHRSFARILDRLTTTDKNRHMPLGDVLKPEVLDPFVAWLKERIAQSKSADRLEETP